MTILKPKEGFFGLEGLFMLLEAGIIFYVLQLNRPIKRLLWNLTTSD